MFLSVRETDSHCLKFLELSIDLLRYLSEFLLWDVAFLVVEVYVGLGVHRQEVYVSMWHLEPEHHLRHLPAAEHALDGHGHLLCEHLEGGYLVVGEVEDVVYFVARDDERMSFRHRVDVEESIEMLVFGTLIRRYLACCNL